MLVGAALLWPSTSCLHGRDSAPGAGGAAGLHRPGGASREDGRGHEQGPAPAQAGAPRLPAAPAPQVSHLTKTKPVSFLTNLFASMCIGQLDQIQIIYTFHPVSDCFAAGRFLIDCLSIHCTLTSFRSIMGSRKDDKNPKIF